MLIFMKVYSSWFREKISIAAWYAYLAVCASILRQIEITNGWVIQYGHYDPPYYMNDFIKFLGTSLVLLFMSAAYDQKSKTIHSGILVRLAIGKVFDEFASPFGYWWGELLWDVFVGIWAIRKWWKDSRKEDY